MGIESTTQDTLISRAIYTPLADLFTKYKVLAELKTDEEPLATSITTINTDETRVEHSPIQQALTTIQRFANVHMKGKNKASNDHSPEALFVENIRQTWVAVSTQLVTTFSDEADRIVTAITELYHLAAEQHVDTLTEDDESEFENDGTPLLSLSTASQTAAKTRDDYNLTYQAMLNINNTRKHKVPAEQQQQNIENNINSSVANIIAYANAVYSNPNAAWLNVHVVLLEKQIALIEYLLANQQFDEQEKLEKEILRTSLKIKKAKAKALVDAQNLGAVDAPKDLSTLKQQRELELKYQKSGRAFAALYGLGQGAYCAGFTAMLIGLNYFMNNALVAAFGWPSLLLIVVALPLFLTTLSNYWMMRKDMGIMAQHAHDKRHQHTIKSKHTKTAKEKLSDNYVWAIVTAVLGGILCSTLTAYGIFQLLPGALGIALPLTFFVITIVPELVLNINHNKKFWAAPIKTMKDAYHKLDQPKYKARFMFWVFASTVGMVFTALALTSLANLVGIPFYISFPLLCAITLSNVSFYFNRAIDHVSRQKQMDEQPDTVKMHAKQLSTGFSIIRLSNAFSNSLVAVIGFMATVASAGLITVHGTTELALANLTSVMNFSAPSVILCLCMAVVVGILAGATSYIANAAGKQEGYESIMKEDLMVINAEIKFQNNQPSSGLGNVYADLPNPVSHWYPSRTQEDKERYVNDVEAIAGVKPQKLKLA